MERKRGKVIRGNRNEDIRAVPRTHVTCYSFASLLPHFFPFSIYDLAAWAHLHLYCTCVDAYISMDCLWCAVAFVAHCCLPIHIQVNIDLCLHSLHLRRSVSVRLPWRNLNLKSWFAKAAATRTSLEKDECMVNASNAQRAVPLSEFFATTLVTNMDWTRSLQVRLASSSVIFTKRKRKRRTGAWSGPRWKQPLSPPWRISAWRPSSILWQEQNFPWKFGCRRGGNEKQWRRSRTFSAKSLAARSTKFPSEPHLGVKSTTESRKKFYVTNRRLLRTRKGKKGEAKQSRTVLMRRWICHQPKAKTLDGMRRKKRKTGSRSLRRTQLCLTVRQRPWDLCRALSPPWRKGRKSLRKPLCS